MEDFCPPDTQGDSATTSDPGRPEFYRVRDEDESKFPKGIFSAVKMGMVEATGSEHGEGDSLGEATIHVDWNVQTSFTDLYKRSDRFDI